MEEAGGGGELVPVGRYGGAPVASPLMVFPAEIWKLIMEELDDSNDVFNMFEVIPEMKDMLTSSRHKYLFDRVIAHIAEWIDEEALLNCRRVCKMWQKGLDRMVENQPSLRAYHHDSSEPSQNWNPRNYSKVDNGKETEDPSMVLFRRHLRWRYSFHSQIVIHRFTQKFALLAKAGHNPFIGRSVMINRFPWGDNSYIISFWNNALAFLREYGKHIWFIEIWEFIHQDPFHFAQSVQRSLALLPNLRSLHLEGNMSWATINDNNTIIIKTHYSTVTPINIATFDFPRLPHLETLKIGDGFPHLVETVINHYSPQIRRLVWSTRGWNWEKAYEKKFPNLTEFILVVRSTDKQRTNQLLLSLQAPQLYRLYVGFRGEPAVKYTKEEIAAWMKRFPRLSVPHFRLVSQL